MIPGRQRPVAFERSGARIRIRLGSEERDLIVGLVDQFRSVLTDDDDPSLRRLYPTAYPDDAEQATEYESLVHDDLVRSRLTAVDTVESTVRADSIDPDELASWMGMLNGLRLLLGTRLDPDAPDAPSRALLAWLGLLLEEAVAAATAYLPERSDA